jgi:hypothetical protein
MSPPERPFVLLCHRLGNTMHWDLMLDTGGALATWQLAADPTARPADQPDMPLPARRLADHRRLYLDYEGPVSGDRGDVVRIDRGVYILLDQQAAQWTIELLGDVLSGRFSLSADLPGSDSWELRRVDT